MAGVVSCIIRFACHIPTGMMGFTGHSLDNTANGVHDLDVFPNASYLQRGLHVVNVAGIVTFSWNFVMFAISPFCSGFWLFLIGVVDLALACVLLAGVLEQARFLPHTYAACNQATDWRNGTDYRNFFVAVSLNSILPNGTMTESPNGVCSSMVHNWALTIAIVIIYLLCGLINVFAGTFTGDCFGRSRYYSSASWRYSTPSYRWYSSSDRSMLSSLCLPWLYIFQAIWKLPHMVVSPCRYTVRYLSKFFQKTKYRNEIRLQAVQTRKQQACGEGSTMPPSRPLPFDVQVLIFPQLHFADLVNLSRSSKLLRWRILGEPKTETRLENFRQYTCHAADRSQCHICNLQICSTCSTQVSIRDSLAIRHLKTCRAYCRKCFYSVSRQWKTGERIRTTRHHKHCGHRYNTPSLRTLCRFCAAKTPSEREQMLEARDRQEAWRLARLPLACDSCKVLLQSAGPRWWVCGTCSAECTNDIHPPWATPV